MMFFVFNTSLLSIILINDLEHIQNIDSPKIQTIDQDIIVVRLHFHRWRHAVVVVLDFDIAVVQQVGVCRCRF